MDKIVKYTVHAKQRFDKNLGKFVPDNTREILAKCSKCGFIYNIRYMHKCVKNISAEIPQSADKPQAFLNHFQKTILL